MTYDTSFVEAVLAPGADLEGVATALHNYSHRHEPLSDSLSNELAAAKERAVAAKDEHRAKVCWCLQEIEKAQSHYLTGFNGAKRDEFYGFWQQLEQVELALHFLRRHFPTARSEYGLRHLQDHIPRFQALYPYLLFMSPGMIVKAEKCSICEAPITIRGGCGHEIGDVYRGEMCSRIITDIDLLEISLVETPVQKYSVPFGPDISYEYGAVHYVIRGLTSPWHEWTYSMQFPDALPEPYPGTPELSPCPCGGRLSYRNCHLRTSRRQVHYEVTFAVQPPADLPRYLPHTSFRQSGTPPEMAKAQVATGG